MAIESGHATSAGPMRAAVVHPRTRRHAGGDLSEYRTPEAYLAEAVGLAKAIALDVRHAEVVGLNEVHPKTYIGSGKVESLAATIAAHEIGVVIFDGPLTGIQQRNLEKDLAAKVIDRTGLILEIFGQRARTAEGALQVELAALEYQKSRLVRSWTHLERQRGGFGFLGGPGETQIEADRRVIRDRIGKIKRELDRTKKTRGLHRENRNKVPWPTVALVGYTNAGKSTLFNRLAGSEVFAADMLFATLDPTMRGVTLPSGRKVILSDTVGFIADLPPQLVAAFRATLEEVVQADILLHVRDIAHPDTNAQRADVLAVLTDLGVADAEQRMIEVLNKIDVLDADTRAHVVNTAARDPRQVALSAQTGDGIDRLMVALERQMATTREVIDVDVPLGDGQTLAWLYAKGVVHERQDDEAIAHIRVGLQPADAGRFRKRQATAD